MQTPPRTAVLSAAPADVAAPGWQARLTLGFTRRGQRTVLSHRAHSGPLQVQRPFYPEGDGTCHVYLLHPPGGLVGGDGLTVEAAIEAGARVLLTTPAAGKCYRSRGATARLIHRLRVAPGAALEWLPQETLCFDGARVQSLTRVELTGDGAFLGWEILCLGRPAAGEGFAQGVCRQRLEVWRDGAPLYLEQGRYEGGSALLAAPWGLAARPTVGTLVCVTRDSEALAALRARAAGCGEDELFAASQLDEVLVCRYLGPCAERARALFVRAWTLLRPAVLGKAAVVPRIWNT